MTEKILSNLYRIEIPLPGNPLGAVNCYLIKSGEGILIVDTGMNRRECQESLFAGLKELNIDLDEIKVDIFITHIHADHSGLAFLLFREGSKVYFNQIEAGIIAKPNFFKEFSDFAKANGFPEKEWERAIGAHPLQRTDLPFTLLKEGDQINIGDYQFRCIETPGHSRGHLCLYESKKKILISGDHVLRDVTPNISSWLEELNPLEEYLMSLDKVYKLDVELVLPGHGRIFRDFKERINELKIHHQNRLNEVLSILEKGEQNAYRIASQMTWDFPGSWDEFPPLQHWFACGEVVAHLKYLKEKGKVQKKIKEKEIFFSGSRTKAERGEGKDQGGSRS